MRFEYILKLSWVLFAFAEQGWTWLFFCDEISAINPFAALKVTDHNKRLRLLLLLLCPSAIIAATDLRILRTLRI
jgi:hypothetical protein